MVVVGGGHNGLVCAAFLARAGLDVLVVERNSRCGGALFSTTKDGFTLEHGAVDHSTIIGSTIPDELKLRRGRSQLRLPDGRKGLHLYGDGVQIAIAGTADDTARSIAEVDAAESAAWMELAALSGKLLALTGELSRDPPVPLEAAQRLGRLALGRAGQPIIELARSSAVEVAERWFRSPHMRALAVFRSQFSGLPPWYPGTGAVFALTPAGHGRRLGRSTRRLKSVRRRAAVVGRRLRRAGPVRLRRRAQRDPRRWRLADRVHRVRRGVRLTGRGVGRRSSRCDPAIDRPGRRAGAAAAEVRTGRGDQREPQPVHRGCRAAQPTPRRPPLSGVHGESALDAPRATGALANPRGRARRHPRRSTRRAPHLPVAARSLRRPGGRGHGLGQRVRRPSPGGRLGPWSRRSPASASGPPSTPACRVCASWSPTRCSRRRRT